MLMKRQKGRIKECVGFAFYLFFMSMGSRPYDEYVTMMGHFCLLAMFSLVATMFRWDFWFRIVLYPLVAVAGYTLFTIHVYFRWGYGWDDVASNWSYMLRYYLLFALMILSSQWFVGLLKEVEYRNMLKQRNKGRIVEGLGCALSLLLIVIGHFVNEEYFIMISAICFLAVHSLTATIFRSDLWFRVLLYPPTAVLAFSVPLIANKFSYGFRWNYVTSAWPKIVLIFLCFVSIIFFSQWLKTMLKDKKVISPERRSI